MGGIQSKLPSETQSEEISIISSDICEVRNELKSDQKETNLRQLTCANEKVSAADDEMAPKKLEDRKLCSRYQENDGTKALLLAPESKCSQVERKTHMSNVVKTIPVDEYTKVQDQLKSKKDQFNDLVEAHQKLRSEVRSSESQWKMERWQLNQKISDLEWNLRAKSVSYDLLVIDLGLCKLSLTIKLDKEKLYEDMFEKCREQQSKIVQKDNELVNLRYVLATMDILFEGMQLKNHELRRQKEDILEEFQKERAASLQPLSKLKKRLLNLQIEHGSCSTKLELKETEWRYQLERLKAGAGCSDAYSKLLCENKNMLGESKRKQMLLEECVMKIEEISKCEMPEKTHERNSIDAGSQSWKNDDEVPKSSFEGQLEIEQASDQEIENLKSAVKEHEEKIGDLQHQVTSLESISPVKDDATYTMVEEQNL